MRRECLRHEGIKEGLGQPNRMVEGLSPTGLPKIERVQFHSGPGFSKLQVAPAQNNQKQEGMAKTDVRAASLPGEDIERIS